MEEQSKGGIGITPIIVALIGFAGVVVTAFSYTRQQAPGGGSAQSTVEPHPPLKISGDAIEYKQTSHLGQEECVRRSRQALQEEAFVLAVQTDRTITMKQGDVLALVRCRRDSIVLGATGPGASNPEGAMAQMRSAIREELSAEVRPE